ncbi:hypothetical protein [uncultured Methanobrevibacter sp.]|uniref:hypothetical protein n=1 Tax=uncultured Methanobrevibacter sp. TaxID=253161 RepID=UPI0025D26B4E|nr:hypothetical protein [uncultured Methanobrevibacter sp.]
MKMEIELTDEQAQKVEILKENGIEVGEAIEMFFDMRDVVSESGVLIVEKKIEEANKEKAELEQKIEKVDKDLSYLNKIKDTSLDITQKKKIVEKEYGINKTKTYDEEVMDTRHKVKWSNFFKH